MPEFAPFWTIDPAHQGHGYATEAAQAMIVAVILFRYSENGQGRPMPNNYVVTAYQKEIG